MNDEKAMRFMWFLKKPLSQKRLNEYYALLSEAVEDIFKTRSLPADSFYKWAKDKIDENMKFGRSTCQISRQLELELEINAIKKTLEIYEAHMKERGTLETLK